MNSDSLYLSKLTFPSKLTQSFIYTYITNIRFVLLLILAIVPVGIFSLSSLPRRLNPEVNIPIVTVITSLPGASPQDIEKLITEPFENEIAGIDGVQKIESTSSQNLSVIAVEFSSTTDINDAKRTIDDEIDSVSLPANAQSPRVSAVNIEDQPIITYALTSKTLDPVSLSTLGRELKRNLESTSAIDRVEVSPSLESSIEITLLPEVMKTYSITPSQIFNRVREDLKAFPAGNIDSLGYSFSVSLDQTIQTIDDIRSLPITIENTVVTLQTIALVQEKSEQDGLALIKAGDEFLIAYTFDVFRTSQSDITTAVQSVQSTAREVIDGHNVELITISSAGQEISDQFNELFNNFVVTLLLVFLTLFAFLGIRQSTIVAFSIPLTMLIAFSVMNAAGLSLNFLTVFSLLLGLGLLVDDAIVVVSAMTSYMATKKFTPHEAGALVWRDYIVPIWSTTLTTVWAFIPLLLASGIIGEFIKTIPIVVSSALIASTSVAVLITLPLTMQLFDLQVPKRVIVLTKILTFLGITFAYVFFIPREPIVLFIIGLIVLNVIILVYGGQTFSAFKTLIKRPLLQKYAGHGIISTDTLMKKYRQFIDNLLGSTSAKRKAVALVIFFSLLSYLLVPLGFVKNEFFPKTDSKVLTVQIDLPNGSLQNKTEEIAKNVSTRIPKNSGIETILITIKESSPQQASIQLSLDDSQISSIALADELRTRLESTSQAEVSVLEQSGGPPVGNDIELSITGDDPSVLESISRNITTYLEAQDGVVDVTSSIEPSLSRIVFEPYKDVIVSRGISVVQIGSSIAQTLGSTDIETVTFSGGVEQDIIFTSLSQITAEQLTAIEISTPQGFVPLAELGRFVPETSVENIQRLNGKRKVTLSASTSANASISEINQNLLAFVEDQDLPDGYETVTGGVNQENAESVQSILMAMILSAVLIFATMVLQLGSFRKAIIVLLVIPLAVSGVFVLFAITNTPLSFPALIGLLALFGIVVNNSIMLVEKINQNQAIGLTRTESISDAAASRLEPILFSSITTLIGLIPITLTDPLWRGLGGAIIAGLSVSGAIMLIFIPTIYSMWFPEEKS